MTKPIMCGCGRSPIEQCVGFHALTEDEWLGGMTQLKHAIRSGQQNPCAQHIITEDGNELAEKDSN
jgi:hypothetical protein